MKRTAVARPVASFVVPVTSLAVLALLAAYPLSARAANISCGVPVTQSVALDGDLECTSGDAIVIGASNIVVDLKGHTVSGSFSSDLNSGVGVHIRASGGYHDVVVRNGMVVGFGIGVRIDSAQRNRISTLTLADHVRGIDVANASFNVIEKSRIYGSDLDGVRFGGGSSNNQVLQSTLSGNTWGISLADQSHDNVISQNQITTSTNYGIGAFGTPNANLISRNVVSSSIYDGIRIQDAASSTVVSQNKTTSNGANGIAVWGGTTGTELLQNTSSGNGQDGIEVSAGTTGTTVTKNTATYNTGWGIEASGVIDGGGNTAFGNGAGQCTGVTCSAE